MREKSLSWREFQTNKDELEESLEEILVEANKGDMITLNTHHPPRSHEHLSPPTTFHEPPSFFPTPPTPKTLNPNFCQSISEPLLKAPNFELRAFEELVRSKSKKSPTSTIQISKGHEEKRASKIKGKLFEWLILFQPYNESRKGGNHLNWFEDKSFLTRGGWWRSLHALDLKEANQLSNFILLFKGWINHPYFV